MDREMSLIYTGSTNQVRVSFRSDSMKSEKQVLMGLVKRARSKLQDEIALGHIENYIVYDGLFEGYWEFLQHQLMTPPKILSFVLAQGYKKLPGFSVRQDPTQNHWLVSLPERPDLLVRQGWGRVLAQFYQQAGIRPETNLMFRTCIWEAIGRALQGEIVKDFRLRIPIAAVGGSGSRLILDREHHRVLLLLHDIRLLNDEAALNRGVKKILEQLAKLPDTLSQFHILKQELYEVLRSMQGSPESFGYGLPLCIPVAIGPSSKARQSLSNSSSAKSLERGLSAAAPAVLQKISEKAFEIQILAKGFEAQIVWFDHDKFSTKGYGEDRQLIERELAAQQITYGYRPYMDKLLSMITLGQDLRGQTIALGVLPEAGHAPYLHPCFLEKHLKFTDEKIDMRSAQNRNVVNVGDLICEPRYRDGKAGTNIFGETIYAEVSTDVFDIKVGSGIDAREDGRCFALVRGVPHIEGNAVSCRQVYVHQGDVNLQSGDIFFDGSIEILGSIDSGARVYAKGDIIVRGGIGQSKVRCEGDLRVERGIVTSKDGLVYVKGSAYAKFIENSRIVIGQDLEVTKSIINSETKVGGEIIIVGKDGGVIGGGTLVAQGGIQTFDLGFKDGEKTIVQIGCDWQLEFRMSLFLRRERKIKRYLTQVQYRLEELKNKKNTVPEDISKLEGRMLRARKLIERIDKAVQTNKTKMQWSEGAVLMVKGHINPNLEVTLGGRNIPISKAMMNVMITAVEFRGNYINPLIFIDKFRKKFIEQAS